MKHILFFLLVMVGLLPQTSFSQTTTPDSVSNQISVDAGGLIKLITNTNYNNSSAILLNWRKLGERSNTRIGFGLDANFQTQNQQNSSFLSLSLSIGKERFADFAQRWQAFYGWDFVTHFTTQKFGENSEYGLTFGGGPLVGIHFKINERLWVSTEAAFHLLAGFKNKGEDNLDYAIQTAFLAPTTVFLGYRF